MPVVRYYEVEERRIVKVTANSAADAVRIGEAAFAGKLEPEGVMGHVTVGPNVTYISATEG